ncbi:hypothetical protein XNC1_2867 [Xenorhabdus nematophila ATCC 19061]|uniref:Uncharacterized protein n=1 Tax=Xenorhabdus nematophila (strain ATCC 19061 / DSM 3370 / CCUG 14189 / LMG 1036 / NCIMB 9965 / AN6) TaxID=406817 RepID=D3VJ64_XENNA|nr:hypothetical protein XNC1_2867 [Xenorhabdus nematophila ATCC 19061]CEK23753.1 hypothetical protein XNC2_2759 [Xenorhabdus nematophila AN6/1]
MFTEAKTIFNKNGRFYLSNTVSPKLLLRTFLATYAPERSLTIVIIGPQTDTTSNNE